MAVSIVVAADRNGCIGHGGGLPWHLPSDLKRFRELTVGGAVVMGRRTYESLPDRFRPLPDRRNIVLSTKADYRADGAETFADLESAVAAAGSDCFVIGGGVTYEQALPLASRVYRTLVDADVPGDTFFPALSPDDWVQVLESPEVRENGHAFRFQVLDRRTALYDFDAARSPDQLARMKRLADQGVCIFCAEHDEQPVEYRGEHWYVTRNRFPYEGTLAHYLLVANRHVTAFDELPDEAGAELWAIRRALKEELAPPATAMVERSGDMRFNGGSIAHLHIHFVALGEAPAATVRFRVSARSARGQGVR
jgi:dihydrofolate reductase/diadenosine tetraphosphate (Ap4A) HIT family hydrolase